MKTSKCRSIKINRQLVLLIILSLITLTSISASQLYVNDSLILAKVRSGNIPALSKLLDDPDLDINREFGPRERTLLTYAIQSRQSETALYLIELGADVGKFNNNRTPLMFAAQYGDTLVTRIISQAGAELDFSDREGNTAFNYASRYNKLEVLKVLYDNGADINTLNQDDWTALDYSITNGNNSIFNYLRSIGCQIYLKELPEYFDGPYIDIPEEGKLTIKYMVNNEKSKTSRVISKNIKTSGPEVEISGLKKDKNIYHVSTEPTPPPGIYDDDSKIFVLGDVHGQYARLLKMLKSGGVIDNDLHWSWGEGHLVFIGDIFDRGEQVTEILWLIYRLEKEAERSNGRVHLLIGNHEEMVLTNDIRYVSKKYYGLASNLSLDYYTLFSENTILGRWLRTKNVVEIIGNTMFVHAGVSPELATLDLSINDINESFRQYINGSPVSNQELLKILLGSNGPIWYRGYLRGNNANPSIPQHELDAILGQYSVQRVVVGHTEVPLISPVKYGKVIPVNIPLADNNIIEQALLIEDDLLYRLASDKTKTILNK